MASDGITYTPETLRAQITARTIERNKKTTERLKEEFVSLTKEVQEAMEYAGDTPVYVFTNGYCTKTTSRVKALLEKKGFKVSARVENGAPCLVIDVE